jgi:transposase
MWYLGIDQHARQITISLRDESGDVLQARQVSTQPEKIQAFFQQLSVRNDWRGSSGREGVESE